MQSNIYDHLYSLYPELKFWASVCGVIWAISKAKNKVVDWAKEVKDNHLTHIQDNLGHLEETVGKQTDLFKAAMQENTQGIVGEIKDLRADIRGLTTAFIAPPKVVRRRKK